MFSLVHVFRNEFLQVMNCTSYIVNVYLNVKEFMCLQERYQVFEEVLQEKDIEGNGRTKSQVVRLDERLSTDRAHFPLS